jgi:hypothetical protein
MLRRFFDLCALLSLTASLLVLAWWGWSYRVPGEFGHRTSRTEGTELNGRKLAFVWGRGSLVIDYTRFHNEYEDEARAATGVGDEWDYPGFFLDGRMRWYDYDRRRPRAGPLGFGTQRVRLMWSAGDVSAVMVPMWTVLALSLVPYGIALIGWRRIRRRRRRKAAGCCPQCGYDLRASAGRCPECGSPVAADAPAATVPPPPPASTAATRAAAGT